ncbi:hypothetical protein DMH18_17570 [Streptomyces sp. WAC 06783]|uniref:hypothetical protein n=1 Tax=Streptomyces sp. WAC 06783 TaxID=2203211 RepID=UPI000F735607|nr:hypothetical protein [Streptomyces sp. WAC 06783]RSO09254.1 hypothetical protein DMH18_17570 [Streptomyces sp. WAC 06783]
MLPLWVEEWLEARRAPIEDFFTADDAEGIYQRCVLTAVDDPKIARLLDKRPGVTRDAVLDRMRAERYADAATGRCQGAVRTRYDHACMRLAEIKEMHRRAAAATVWSWWKVCLALAGAGLFILWAGGLLALLVAVVVAVVIVLLLSLFVDLWVWDNLRQCLLSARWGAAWVTQRIETGSRAVHWGELLQEQGVEPVVAQLVRHMLGDDPDSVFIPDDYAGLRAPRAPDEIVENEAFRQMSRKLTHIEYGTIAVCGPRGSGKTTLLEHCVASAPFGLLAQAPATYAPHDFLLSLSVRLCEKYLRDRGCEVPEFTRLSPLRRLLHRTSKRIGRLGRWSAFAVPAGALLALGLSAPVRTLYAQYAHTLADFVQRQAELAWNVVTQIWQGQAVVASLLVAFVGIAWWQSRRTAWLPRLLAKALAPATVLLGIGLALVSVISVILDQQLITQVLSFRRTPTVLYPLVLAANLGMLWRFLAHLSFTDGHRQPPRRWHIAAEYLTRAAAAATGIAFLLVLVSDPRTYALLADPENPLRLAGIVAATLLIRAGRWRPRPAEPQLVTRCRDHLYRLQTTQTSSHALTTGASQMLSLGTSHTTSISTVPPNFPALVEDFRTLLAHIAAEKAAPGKPVVIAIDEVDRLGSASQALAFLSEIKAILGVPHVYYLISVAEDVGAAFVRRGLPHRDVTDSSLDDILHVQPSTLTESRAILTAHTGKTLAGPYVTLAHALSGGVLRDLVRYGLQIKEMREKSQSYELAVISRHLIMEELSETLAGFRTLLSNQRWTDDTGGILSSFRTLCGYLRTPCPCTEGALQRALEDFAFRTDDDRSRLNDGELADDARQLIDEASAYAYFSLTLLDIFSAERLAHRAQQAAARGSDGDAERLAEARQELGISPHSARRLIKTIRIAWSLPLQPVTDPNVPQPRPGNCPLHSAPTS